MRLSKMVLLLGTVCSFSVMDGYGMNEEGGEINDDQPQQQRKRPREEETLEQPQQKKQLAPLSSFPQEMIFSICSYLQPKDLMKVFTLSKQFLTSVIQCNKKEQDKFFNRNLYEIANELICNQDKNILLLRPEEYTKIQGGNIGLCLKIYQHHLDSFKWEAARLINKINNYQECPLRLVLKYILTPDTTFLKSPINTPQDKIFIQGTKWDTELNDLRSYKFKLISKEEFQGKYKLSKEDIDKDTTTDDQRFMSFLSQNGLLCSAFFKYKDNFSIKVKYLYYYLALKYNKKEALKNLEEIANQGYVEAQFNLSRIYFADEEGIDKDIKKALKYATLAARSGHFDGENLLTYIKNRAE